MEHLQPGQLKMRQVAGARDFHLKEQPMQSPQARKMNPMLASFVNAIQRV